MAPSQSISTLPDHLLYKNRLQEYTQKSALPLPIYTTINDGGFPHAPKFRSTVMVDGTNYASNLTFSHIKAAELDVAKHALDCIAKKIKEDPPITNLEFQDPMGYKSILHEFAVKSNRKIATYRTQTEGGSSPVFISSVLFDSKTYKGQISGSKKMAEQLAAHAAITELLGSDMGNLLHEIVKSKGKLHSASPSVNELSITETILPLDFKPETSPQPLEVIPQSINNLNSSDRVMSPIPEEKHIMETQNWESGKRLIDFGRMTSSKKEGKNVIETQIAETKKRNSSCFARIATPYAGVKRASEAQNVQSKKKVNVGMRMTCPTAEPNHKMEASRSIKQKNGFNSLGIMVGPNREEKRKIQAKNVEQRKSFNSSGRMISPSKMDTTTRIQHKKIELKRKF